MLLSGDFLIFESRDFPLKLGLVGLLVVGDALESGKLFDYCVALGHHLVVGLCRLFKLASDVVDVALESENLLDVVLFLLLMLSDLE